MRFRLGGWRRWLLAFIGVAVLVTLAGYLLPRGARFPDTVATLAASPAELFPLLNTRDGHRRAWTRASEHAGAGNVPPMTHADLGGPAGGVGTRTCFCLSGEGLGLVVSLLGPLARGEGDIVESVPNRRVVYEIDWGFMVTRREFHLEALAERRTRVLWSETVDAANPLVRYLWLASAWFPRFDGVLAAAAELAVEDRRLAR